MLSRDTIITSVVIMLDEGFGEDIVAKIEWLERLRADIESLIDTYTRINVNNNFDEES